jgi:hypothetical protein
MEKRKAGETRMFHLIVLLEDVVNTPELAPEQLLQPTGTVLDDLCIWVWTTPV